MSIIEQAAKRLEELRRAGVDVPWAAAGLTESEYENLTGGKSATGADPAAAAATRPAAAAVSASALANVPAAAPVTAPAQRVATSQAAAAGGAAPARAGAPGATAAAAVPRTPRLVSPGPAVTGQDNDSAFAPDSMFAPDSLFAPDAATGVAPDPALTGRRSRRVMLDLPYLAATNFLVPDAGRSALADEFRVIKRPLIKNAQGEGAAPVARGNLICVTSALPGEGKTFCAINLALSIAMEVDKTVLLVDADVVRPSVMQRLGLDPGRGLLDLLTDPEVKLPDVLLRTNVPKLSLLPSGTPVSNSTELLASAAMELLLDELATKYADRIIVFDGPPLLATTESRVLAARVGQVVMVVESGKTTQGAVAQAFATVEHCPVVMSVLNKFHGQGASYRYGYYGY